MSRIALRAALVVFGLVLLLACVRAPWVWAQRGAAPGGPQGRSGGGAGGQLGFVGGGMGGMGGMMGGMGGMGSMGGAVGADTHPARRPVRAPARWTQSTASAAETKIRAQLDAPTQMDFVDSPLGDAIDYLKDLHGIEIQLDTAALEDAGIGTDTPIRLKLSGIPLRPAMHLMLDPLGLIFVVRDEVLLITTPAAAGSLIELRIYAVGDLGDDDEDLNELADFLRLLGGEIELHAFRKLLFARGPAPIQEELSRTLADLRGKLNGPK